MILREDVKEWPYSSIFRDAPSSVSRSVFRTGVEQQATVSIRERRRVTRDESHGILVALSRTGVPSRHV